MFRVMGVKGIRIGPPRRPLPRSTVALCRSMRRKLRSEDAEEANFGFICEEAPGTDPAPKCARLPERMW
jgi:hypothetical protein